MAHRRSGLIAAGAFCAAMALFGIFAHRPELAIWKYISLAAAAVCVGAGVSASGVREIFCLYRPVKFRLGWLVISIATAAGLAVYYRFVLGSSLFPSQLTWFAIIAVAIGVAEELAYRGFVQEGFKSFGPIVAALLAAAGHTAYKSCLFVLPADGIAIDFPRLIVATLAFGFAFGLVRHYSGTILWPVIMHAGFDFLVYGDCVAAPWWVASAW